MLNAMLPVFSHLEAAYNVHMRLVIAELIISFPGVLSTWSNYHIISTLIVCHFVKLMPFSFYPQNEKQYRKNLPIKTFRRLFQDCTCFHRDGKRKLKDHRLARCKLGETHFNTGKYRREYAIYLWPPELQSES